MRQLKICLWIIGVLCLLSVFGLVISLSSIESIATKFGSPQFPDAPLFGYAVKVMFGTYFAIGLFYIILALSPMRYGVLVPFSGLAAILVGVVCLMSGIKLGLSPLVYLIDTFFCLLFGVLIVVFWLRGRAQEGRAETGQPERSE